MNTQKIIEARKEYKNGGNKKVISLGLIVSGLTSDDVIRLFHIWDQEIEKEKESLGVWIQNGPSDVKWDVAKKGDIVLVQLPPYSPEWLYFCYYGIDPYTQEQKIYCSHWKDRVNPLPYVAGYTYILQKNGELR